MVDLEEGDVGASGADRPDRPDGPPGRSGEKSCPIPKPSASVDVTAARGQRLGQAVVQRGLPGHLQVRVGLDPERHFRARLVLFVMRLREPTGLCVQSRGV